MVHECCFAKWKTNQTEENGNNWIIFLYIFINRCTLISEIIGLWNNDDYPGILPFLFYLIIYVKKIMAVIYFLNKNTISLIVFIFLINTSFIN